MKYTWDEIESLATILAQEAEGKPVDRQEASRLADRLAKVCPDIKSSMAMIKRRMVA